MSIRISVVCEDHTLDQYVVRPVISALMAEIGKPRCIIRVVTDPKLNGIDGLRQQFTGILRRYAAVSDVVIFAIDADGKDGLDGRGNRKAAFDELLEGQTDARRGAVVVAVQELEVWALWGSRTQIRDSWQKVRAELHPKERYFAPLLTDADKRHPGKGRARLTELSLANGWASLRAGCPELGALEAEIRERLAR